MRTVKIAALKAKLSAHLKYVQSGEEIIVCDRDRAIARISPIEDEEFSAWERKLIAEGRMIPPKKRRDPNAEWPTPPGNISDEVAKELWDEERGVR
jgi:antitoxin (DNA-binding transcriptional repressor) of toxin-antitoxin stability system